MRERERSTAASGGLRNGFAEWVRRSGGFDEWVRRSGFEEWVRRSGFEEWVFWVLGMEGTMKLEGMTRRCFGHCSTNELGLGWVEDEIGFGWIGLGW